MILKKLRNMLMNTETSRELLLKHFPEGSIWAEIWVWKWDFSEIILHNVQPKTFYLIDPWKFQPEYPNSWYWGKLIQDQAWMDEIYYDVKERFKKYDNVEIIREISNRWIQSLEDESLDRVYIDWNHAYEFVLEDIKLSYKKVKKWWYITWDDFYNWPGLPIKRAVEKALESENLHLKFIDVYKNQFIIKKIA